MKKQILILLVFFSFRLLSQVNLTSGLVACYPLNGNGTELMNNLTGTLSSVLTPTVDRFGNPSSAVYLDGTNGNIELPDTNLLKATQVSFAAWVYFDNLSTYQFIAFVYNGCTAYQEGYQLAVGAQYFEIATAKGTCDNTQIILNSSTGPISNTWYHVGFYAGADSLKLFVDGNQVGAMLNNNALVYGQGTHVYLGGSTGASINLPMHGSIDNARFYNRKLNNAEFKQLYLLDPTCKTEVSLTEYDPESALNLYPNPFEEKLNIDGISSITQYSVHTIEGNVVLEGTIEPGSSRVLDLGKDPKGIYFLRLNVNGKMITKKIVKTD